MAQQLSLIHLVREPSVPAAGMSPLLLLLHGIGSNEADLFGLTPYLDERLRIVSARAPVALGPGAFGWFNIEFTPTGLVADLAQAERSRALLATFIDELLAAYPTTARRLYLMGFSQGAMMSLSLLLAQADKIAGVVAMSGRFPTLALEQLTEPQALAGLPVLVTHGLYDPVLPIESGRAIRARLAALPVALTYREYPMGHEVTPESLRDTAAWLTMTLNAAEAAPGTSAG
jgi:phospholipase/carboxylesterase